MLDLLGLLGGPSEAVENGGVDWTGADGVDSDLAVFQVDGPAASEGTHRSLGRAVDAEGVEALGGNDGGIEDDRPSIDQQRKRLLHGEEKTLDVGVESLVEMFFGDRPEGREFTAAGIGEDDIDVASLLLDGCVQAVEVGEFGHVALDSGDVLANRLDRLVEFSLAAAGNEDLSAFGDEMLSGGQADAAGASGDDGYFSIQLSHDRFSFELKGIILYCVIQMYDERARIHNYLPIGI